MQSKLLLPTVANIYYPVMEGGGRILLESEELYMPVLLKGMYDNNRVGRDTEPNQQFTQIVIHYRLCNIGTYKGVTRQDAITHGPKTLVILKILATNSF